jgi:hypothetical protein
LAEQRELAFVLQVAAGLRRQPLAPGCAGAPVPRTRSWGGYVLTEANYVNAFFSHDEYIDFFAQNSENLADIRKVLGPSQPTASGTATL